VVEGRQSIRFGPLPAGMEGERGVRVEGLRTPEGGELRLPAEPVVVAIPPAAAGR
jgi:hypothetical protein